MDPWRWGKLHTITLAPQVPAPELAIPSPDEPGPSLANGFPRAGDGDSIDAARHAYDDLDFTYDHGPAFRHITEFAPGGPPRSSPRTRATGGSRRPSDARSRPTWIYPYTKERHR